MKLSREEVDHLATLARLGLAEEERDRFRDQLSNILDNFEVLREVDTEGVSPTAQSIDLENVMRSDEVAPSSPQEVILANAPNEEEGYFRVKAVLE